MKAPLVPATFFMARTPYLPWRTVIDLLGDPTLDPSAIDLARVRDRVLALAEDPSIQEAIYLASPSLHERMSRLHAGDESGSRRDDVELAFLRYLQRMSVRPTPFGLFSGVTLGTVGDGPTVLELQPRTANRRHVRLDMSLLLKVVDAVTGGDSKEWRGECCYRTNQSLYKWRDTWRYVEPRVERGDLNFDLAAVGAGEAVSWIIEAAWTGAPLDQLCASLVEREQVDIAEARAFLQGLIGASVLQPVLDPCLTGISATQSLAARLRDWPGESAAQAARALERLDRTFSDLRNAKEPVPPGLYAATVDEFGAQIGIHAEPGRAIQVDLEKPSRRANLHPRIAAEVGAGAELLRRIDRRSSSALEDFLIRFEQRYENAAVPLMEALDDEAGLGFDAVRSLHSYPSPLLDGLAFPSAPEPATWDPSIHTRFQNWIVAAVHERRIEIELSDADVEAVASRNPRPLPRGVGVLATIAARDPEAIAGGEFRVWIQSVVGPNAGVLFARFCEALPGLDERLRRQLVAETKMESDAMHAEVVHLAYGRVGNVVARPNLREFELPFLGRSGAPEPACVDVRDLLLQVTEGQPVLWSRSHGRRVVPHLTNAHTYSARGNVGLYRFLGAIQQPGPLYNTFWQWGPLEWSTFLPRVRKGRIVLALARWRLNKEQLRALESLSAAHRFDRIQEMRRNLGWPRHMRVVDADNLLPMDLDNPLSVEAAWATLRKKGDATLSEAFPDTEEELWATGPEGRFQSEVVVPFANPETRARPAGKVSVNEPCRRFVPGDAWIYLKLYTGTNGADSILADHVPRIVESLQRETGPIPWFVVRYGDPDWHVRLRVRITDPELRSRARAMMEAWAASLSEDGLVWRVQIDTYVPELARYGGTEGIACAEEIFAADSEAAVALVRLTKADHAGRWQVCLLSVERLLADLGCLSQDRARIFEEARRRFGVEFRAEEGLFVGIGAKFRKDLTSVEAILNRPEETELGRAAALILDARSRRLDGIAERLTAGMTSGRIRAPLDEFCMSVIHMCANRLLLLSRAVELVIYDYLWRINRSRHARERIAVDTKAVS